MIKELTKEQELDLQDTLNKWLDIGRSTERLNRHAVVKSITNLYKANGNKEPIFWFCDSPLQCLLIIHLFKGSIGGNLKDNLKDNLWNNLWSNLRSNLRDNLENNLRSNLGNNLRDKIKFENYFSGSQQCYWDVFYDFCNRIGVSYNNKDKELLNIWLEQSKECYWWFPFEQIVFCSERPVELHLKEKKLHNSTKPAISFADGYSLYFINGISVPSWIIEQPEQITIEKIEQEKDENIKAIMKNRIGFEKGEALTRYLNLVEK